MKFSSRSTATDLYILPESNLERALLNKWASEKGLRLLAFISKVPGQSWYGKHCFELPFGKHHQDEIEAYLKENLPRESESENE